MLKIRIFPSGRLVSPRKMTTFVVDMRGVAEAVRQMIKERQETMEKTFKTSAGDVTCKLSKEKDGKKHFEVRRASDNKWLMDVECFDGMLTSELEKAVERGLKEREEATNAFYGRGGVKVLIASEEEAFEVEEYKYETRDEAVREMRKVLSHDMLVDEDEAKDFPNSVHFIDGENYHMIAILVKSKTEEEDAERVIRDEWRKPMIAEAEGEEVEQ